MMHLCLLSCRRQEDPYRCLETAMTKKHKMRKDFSNWRPAIQYRLTAAVLTSWRCPGTPNTARTPRKSCTACMLLPLLSAYNAVLKKQLIIFPPPGYSSSKSLSIFSQCHRFFTWFCVSCVFGHWLLVTYWLNLSHVCPYITADGPNN